MWLELHQAKARYDVCKSCDKFFHAIGHCRVCGCYMKLKVKIATQTCPLKKWLPVHSNIEKSNNEK